MFTDDQIGSVNANAVGGCEPGTLLVRSPNELHHKPDSWLWAKWSCRATGETGTDYIDLPRVEISDQQFGAARLTRWGEPDPTF